jgi:hypothetical protein
VSQIFHEADKKLTLRESLFLEGKYKNAAETGILLIKNDLFSNLLKPRLQHFQFFSFWLLQESDSMSLFFTI